MLNVKRNFGLFLCFFQRYIANRAVKENKHYEFLIRHIKTDLDNHSYIVKQTTAIPTEIRSNTSQITLGDITNTNEPETSYNTIFPSKKQSKFKTAYDAGVPQQNLVIQERMNKMVTHYSIKKINPNNRKYIHGIVEEPATKKKSSKYDAQNCCAKISDHRNDIFYLDNGDSESFKRNHQQNHLYSTRGNAIAPFQFDHITNDTNSFSLVKIKELLNEKLKEIMLSNFNKGDIISDDIVILNQKIPERESLIFFKNNEIYVIESSHTNFKNEVKNYIKEIDMKGMNRSAPERLNLIRFYKVLRPDNLHESNIFNLRNESNSWESLNDITLKVKNSMPLEYNADKNWIHYNDYNNDPKNNYENIEYGTLQNNLGSSPKSGPPFTEKVPINKDKLIEDSVVPNTSILNIINSIDKSAVIIQKDLYITDQIIQKIQKEEEERNKEIDKNKLETISKENYIMYLGKPTVKNGNVSLSLAGVSADTNKISNGELSKLHNFYNQSHIHKKQTKKIINKSLQNLHLENKKSIDVGQTTINEFNHNECNDSSASMTLNSLDNGGKISLNMQYEPHKVVPMFSFLSNNQGFEKNAKAKNINTTLDNVAENNLLGQSDISQSYHRTSEDKFKNSAENTLFQNSESLNNNNNNMNQISQDHQNNLNHSNTKIEESSYTMPYDIQKRNGLKDYTPHPKKHINDSTRMSPGTGSTVGDYMNRFNSTKSHNYQLTNIKNSPPDHIENKPQTAVENIGTFSEGMPTDCFNKSNNSIPNSQDENYKLLLMSNERIKKIENTLSKMIQLNETEKIISSQKLSDVQKLLETLINYNSSKRDMSIKDSNYQKNECEKKYPETPKQDLSNIPQQIVDTVSDSSETLLKDNIPKKYISFYNDLKNKAPIALKNTGTFSEGIPTDINKTNNSKLNSSNEYYRELSMRNEKIKKLENELSKLKQLQALKKKKLDITKQDADSIAQHVESVSDSLESLLKDNISNKLISVSHDLKNGSEKNKLKTQEKHSYLTQPKPYNVTPDILNSEETMLNDWFPKTETSEETMLNDYFPKTETSVSNENSSNKTVMTGYYANLNNDITNSENDNYLQSNTKNNEQYIVENDCPVQEEITQSEKECSNIVEEELISNVEPLPKKETSNLNYKYFSNPSNTEACSNDKLSNNIKEYNNKPQNTLADRVNSKLYSLKSSNETGYNSSRGAITKEGSFKKNRSVIVSNINSTAKGGDLVNSFKNVTDSNLPSISHNESKEPPFMKSDDLNPPEFSCSGTSGKSSFDGRKYIENLYKFMPNSKNFDVQSTNKSSVDRLRKTTITSVEKNDFTDINISEIQTYVDSRLPIPFSTETFFQIFGSNHSLRDHSSFIDIAKYNLTSQNKFKDHQVSNLSVMAKLNDIHNSVQNLNILASNLKTESKDVLKNKALVPSKEEIKFRKPETPEKIKEQPQPINKGKELNFLPKFSLKIFNNNNLKVKAHNLKHMTKPNENQMPYKRNEINFYISEIKKQDHESTPKDEKSLLIVKPKADDTKEIRMEQTKRGIQSAELTGIKVSKGKYVDLFSFNKNEKNKKPKVQGNKKGVYDHRGLSKRDRKILREITKEIPKKKLKGKSSRKRPIRSITTKKTKEFEKSLVKNTKDVAGKVTLPKTDIESVNKQILLPPGKHDPEKKVQTTFTDKIENKSHQIVPTVRKKAVENKNLLKSEERKSQVTKVDKIDGNIKISETNSIKAEKFNALKLGDQKQNAKAEKLSIKYAESKNIKNEVHRISNKPLCQTYVATETYINQPEKSHEIPEKIFTSKKILKNNTTPQKVTILENITAKKEDNHETFKIYEGFKEDLIRKSQKKIEHRSNIDFRVRTPKLRSSKLKVTTHKSKQTGKARTVETKLIKDKNNSDMKNKHIVQKTHLKNKLNYPNFNEIRTPKKAVSVQNLKTEELHKVKQSELSNKQTFSQPKPKTSESIAKITTKPQESEHHKIFATDKLETPNENKINIKLSEAGLSEVINKKYFPKFLIDVDKMSKEIKPELDYRKSQKCRIPHDKIIEFPLHNQEKKLLFKPPFKVVSLGPNSDPTLRNELKLFPSVTKVLNSTIPEKSREILREWRKSMIDELGEIGFKSFYKEELINGNKFNWQLHNFLVNGDQYKQDSDNLSLKSIETVFRRTSDLSAINSHVIHRKLAYRGVIDCVAKYRNKPVLIEWKRLENPQVEIASSSIEVAATQLSAYIGALNYDDTYKFQISGGLLVLAFNDGSKAEVIEINNEQCNKHWKMWLKRLQLYHESSSKKS